MNTKPYYAYWLTPLDYKQLPDGLSGGYIELLLIKRSIEDCRVPLPEMNRKLFKYFPAELAEVIALLKNPEGTGAVARLAPPVAGQEEFVKELIVRMSQ